MITHEEIYKALMVGGTEVAAQTGGRLEISWETQLLFQAISRGLAKVLEKVTATPENVSQEVMRTILSATTTQGGPIGQQADPT